MQRAVATLVLVFTAVTASAGSIQGQVTAADDAGPLGGIEVSLYAPAGEGWDFQTFTQTDAGGSFLFDALADGSYRLLFRDWSQTYAFEFSGGASSIDDATDVVVAGGVVQYNADLDIAGRIAGTLTDPGGNSVGSGFVAVYSNSLPLDDVLFIQQLAPGSINYDVGGLPTGAYIVRYSGQVDGQGFAEFHQDVPDAPLTTPVAVTVGDTSIIDTVIGELSGLDIHGTVAGPDNQPLAGIEVSLYRLIGDQWEYTRYLNADGDGSYRFSDVDPGRFRLLFRDWSQNFAFQYWPEAATLQDAEDIVITDASATVNATLALAGRIAGTITDPAGRPLSSPQIAVYPAGSADADVLFLQQPSGTDYDIGGLPSGDYVVQFYGRQSNNRSYAEYYDDAAQRENAHPVSVTQGETTAGINAELGIAPGGTLRGKLRDVYGRPFDFGSVTALADDGNGWQEVAGAVADYLDDDYDYRLDVPAGTYRLRFEAGSYTAPGGATVVEFWNDATDVGQADDISVAVDQRIDGIDATLGNFASGGISGSASDTTGNPLAGIEVIPFDRRLRALYDQISVTDASGGYAINGLWPETYFLRFYDPNGGVANRYYPDAVSPAAATTVAVDGTNVRIDMQLPAPDPQPPGSITGVLGDDVGNPLRGIRVSALEAPCDFTAGFEDCTYVSTTTTAADGAYRVRDLPAGDYHVRFVSPEGRYLGEYYDDVDSAQQAATLILQSAGEITSINAALTPAGSISGTVTNPFGQPFDLLTVSAYAWDGVGWRAVDNTAELNDAEYRVTALPEGSYRVGFRGGPVGANAATEFYDDAADIDSATDVTVLAGQDTGGIDAVLGNTPPGAISGVVLDDAGDPVPGVTVSLYRDYGAQADQRLSDSAGEYRFEPLYDGVYFVAFNDYGGDLPSEFFADVPSLDRATPVIVAGAEVSGIDAILDGANSSIGGGLITGQVSDAVTGDPLPGIRVSCLPVADDDLSLSCSGITDEGGGYLIGGNLISGDYQVSFRDPAGVYATEYFDDEILRTDATAVGVTVGQETANIAAGLALGAGIEGSVTRDGGGFFPITRVALLRLDAPSGQWREVASSLSLNDGMYRIEGVPEGTYRVSFFGTSLGNPAGAVEEFYDNAPDIDSASDLVLNAGTLLTGIDAVLGDLPDPPVTNGHFDMSLQGWSVTGAAATHDNADAFGSDESGSLRFAGAAGARASQCMTLAAANQQVSAWVRGSIGSGVSVSLAIQPFDGSVCDGTAHAEISVTGPTPVTDVWSRLQGQYGPPPGAGSARLSVVVDGGDNPASSIFLDRVSVTRPGLSGPIFGDGFE